MKINKIKNYMKLTIQKANFKKVSLDNIGEALQKGLSKNFRKVSVSVVDCPNLKSGIVLLKECLVTKK